MPTTTGKATDFITFSRASNATVTDSDGKIKWAPHNLLTNSESFDTSSWARNSTVTANAIAAPNGTTTAELIDEGTGSGYKQISQTISSLAGATYTLAVFAKYVSCRWMGLALFDNNSSTQYAAASFDLLNGVVGSTGAAGTGYSVVGTPTMTPLANGWYLCTVTVVNGTSTANRFAFSPSDVGTIGLSGLNSYTGTSKTFYAWGAHLYRSDMAMQANTSAYPMYNPTTPRNLLGYSEDFSNAAWTKNYIRLFGSGSVANAIAAPNGSLSADKIVVDTNNGLHVLYNTSAISVVSGTTYTGFIYVKAAEYGFAFVALNVRSSSSNCGVCVNLADGSRSNAGANGTYTVTSAGDGWWLVSIRATASTTNGYLEITPRATAGGPGAYTGDGTSGIYLWGAQLSDSASLDAYVPSYGAAVTSAAYYGPRRDFDAVTLACKGLLVEEQRTNLLTYSSEFDNGAWLKGVGYSSTVSSNTSVAPDGSSTADSVIADSAGGTGNVILARSTAVTSGTSYTLTFFAKAGTLSWIRLFALGYTSPGNGGAYFNLSGTGAIGTVDAGYTASISAFANGWYRCSLSFAAGSTVTGELRLLLANANNDTAVSRNGASSVVVWGAQLEAGSFATSYIPTGSATATRNADVASVSTQAFPYSASEGTLVANFVPTLTVTDNIRGASLSDGTNRSIDIYTASGQWLTYNGATNVVPGSNTATVGANVKFAAAYKSGDYAAAMNGGTVGTANTAAVATATKLSLGASITNATFLNGHIRQITYLPRRISNAELQSRTA